MPFFTVFFISLLNMLFLTKTYLCMETDFCEPVRLDRENFPSHLTKFAEKLGKGLVVYKINAFNQEFYLSLLPDSSFLAHGGTYHDTSSNAFQGPDFKGCFYSGDINSDKNSYAALSLCRGVRGAFSFREMEYFIERTSINTLAGLNSGDAGKTHIIRRRNVTANATSRCGVTSSSNQGVVESLEKYTHLKGHTMNITETLSRSKRFASIPRYVEVLVVADESMAKFHGDDLKHYLLTLMSVTAKLYKHPSILNSISIVVVKLMVINEAEKGPKVSSNAALTLRNFCTWQKKLNKVNDKHPEYWDTAILFTKQDLCGATTCDTLGMADVGTMCDPKRSCSVIEDDGLPSAFTTAHELGHVFSMPHDNVKACEEVFGKLKDNHMMSPTLIQIDHISPWSVCSAAIITDFLDSGHGDCLLDQPQKLLALPEEPPGVTYSLTRQCELAFGSGSKPCPYMQPCSKLWCTGKAKGQLVCQTRHFPWADGTNCGSNKLCYRGTCTDKQSITTMKVDGRWGRWGHYGLCSCTCGGGVQLSKRDCNNPVPANGGKYCQGLRVKHRSCNLNPCKETGKSFREEQCEAFNGFNLNTNRLSPSVVWVPKYSGVSVKDRCKLICRANGTGYFYVLSPKVVDGTPCSPDTSAVCVQGKCIKAGCDSKLNSDVKFDKCGICGGDNQNCKKVSGMFAKPIHGYNFVVTLPVGAANVDIRQRGYQGLVNDDNYLAVKNVHGNYLLNGNFVVSAVEKDIIVTGSLLRYSGTGTAVEVLQATRPLKESLTVELLSVGKMTPPRVRYSYYVTVGNKQDKTLKKEERNPAHNSVLEDNKVELKKPANQTPSYKWVAADWNKCSVTCGNGVQSRRIQCLDSDGKTATRCNNNQKPSTMRVCGDPCPMWSIGEWSPCSKTCGKGFKRRLLRCVTQTGMHLPRDQCSNRKKPQELDFCTIQSC
ncbi:A disintegrin and metalloproteinase with thrombospondin motifs 15 [Triplophysa rosa]|uniref:A disintegrin and metalloproteinase with thrombospondin motifs 15-like n=1 Tax=Triplophysa rosa TaxID=992332 RepID=A0A9W7TPV4_TRIRA|nr:A disintegrin and metalloproteinase with thrombospondin motifs 15 [Triplophysa rosa]KAI7800636.1 putative A disintegrin and metalloproteinase with thrombospondin motifs 15-like [Triplophysa rosa]